MFCGMINFTPLNFVADGEGQTYGHDDHVNSWPSQLAAIGQMQDWNIVNVAVNGDIVGATVNRYPFATRNQQPINSRVEAVLWMHVGPPDIENGATGQSVYDQIAPVLATAVTQGFIVGVTQCWMNPNPAFDSAFQQFNTLIAACPSVTSGLVFNGAATFTTPGAGPYFIPTSYHLNASGNLLYAQSVYNLLKTARFVS